MVIGAKSSVYQLRVIILLLGEMNRFLDDLFHSSQTGRHKRHLSDALVNGLQQLLEQDCSCNVISDVIFI